jgi:biopolymer transport protein ExbD
MFITAGRTPINLAKVTTAGSRHDTLLVITVTAEVDLFVNNHALTDEQLDATLTIHSRESLVLIPAEMATRLERFIIIVDRIRT